MIKKILISTLTIIGFTMSFSNALNIQDQQLGSTITNDLNFVPNPLNMESTINQLTYKYGRTDEGYIYLGIESNYNGFQNIFGTVRFNYNDQYCSNTTPSLDFYNNVANGTFKPTYFSITSSDYTNTDNYLKFCDSDNNCYYSCCRFYNNTSNNTTTITCGYGPTSVISNTTSISDVGGSFPTNNSPYSLGGGKYGRNNNQICPTLGQIINNYPTNYNTGLCYNNTIIYNNNQIQNIDKRNIQQIFTDYEELSNRRNIYNNNCKLGFTRETCMNAFSGNLDKYELISKGVNENAETKRLRNYCNIYLNYDLNTSSCVASGRQGEQFTTEEITNTILGLDNLTIKTPTTGNILNALLDEGEERANPLDIIGNIDQIKDKFTILFEERNGVNGIIPNYIIWIMLLTILLTVLFKK